ncbi:hypothetical protein JCM10207_007099 [Rhodosporidiobolus poonsookiae]
MTGGPDIGHILGPITHCYTIPRVEAQQTFAVAADPASSGTFASSCNESTVVAGAQRYAQWTVDRLPFSHRFLVGSERNSRPGKHNRRTNEAQAGTTGVVPLRTDSLFYQQSWLGEAICLRRFGQPGADGEAPRWECLATRGEGDEGTVLAYRCLIGEGYQGIEQSELDQASTTNPEPGFKPNLDAPPASSAEVSLLISEVEGLCGVDVKTGELVPPTRISFADGTATDFQRALLVMSDFDGWKAGSTFQATSFNPVPGGAFVQLRGHSPPRALQSLGDLILSRYNKFREKLLLQSPSSKAYQVAQHAPAAEDVPTVVAVAGGIAGLALTTDNRPFAHGFGLGTATVGIVFAMIAATPGPATIQSFVEVLGELSRSDAQPSQLQVLRAFAAYLTFSGVPQINRLSDEQCKQGLSNLTSTMAFAHSPGHEHSLALLRRLVLDALSLTHYAHTDVLAWRCVFSRLALLPDAGYAPSPAEHDPPPPQPSLAALLGTGLVGKPYGLPLQLRFYGPSEFAVIGVDYTGAASVDITVHHRLGQDPSQLADQEDAAPDARIALQDELKQAVADDRAGFTEPHDFTAALAGRHNFVEQVDEERRLAFASIVMKVQTKTAQVVSHAVPLCAHPSDIKAAYEMDGSVQKLVFRLPNNDRYVAQHVVGLPTLLQELDSAAESDEIFSASACNIISLRRLAARLDVDPWTRFSKWSTNRNLGALVRLLKSSGISVPSSFVEERVQTTRNLSQPIFQTLDVLRLAASAPRVSGPRQFSIALIERLDLFLSRVQTEGWAESLLDEYSTAEKQLNEPPPPLMASLKADNLVPPTFSLGNSALDYLVISRHYTAVLFQIGEGNKAYGIDLDVAVVGLGIYTSKELEDAKIRSPATILSGVAHLSSLFEKLSTGDRLVVNSVISSLGARLIGMDGKRAQAGMDRLKQWRLFKETLHDALAAALGVERESQVVSAAFEQCIKGRLADEDEWVEVYEPLWGKQEEYAAAATGGEKRKIKKEMTSLSKVASRGEFLWERLIDETTMQIDLPAHAPPHLRPFRLYFVSCCVSAVGLDLDLVRNVPLLGDGTACCAGTHRAPGF